jgi:SNF family Na+-dependent transporter
MITLTQDTASFDKTHFWVSYAIVCLGFVKFYMAMQKRRAARVLDAMDFTGFAIYLSLLVWIPYTKRQLGMQAALVIFVAYHILWHWEPQEIKKRLEQADTSALRSSKRWQYIGNSLLPVVIAMLVLWGVLWFCHYIHVMYMCFSTFDELKCIVKDPVQVLLSYLM